MLLNRKFVLLIAVICLFLSVFTLTDTYAKYASSLDETTDISIARWRILVNDFDVRGSSTTSNLISPTFNGTTHIAGNVIAPTAQGYFVLVIDATDVDLAFNYSITVGNAQNSLVSDVKITSCTMNNIPVTLTNGTATGTIGLADQRVNYLHVYIEWDDGVNATMDNEADTATTLIQDAAAQISVNANFTQAIS